MDEARGGGGGGEGGGLINSAIHAAFNDLCLRSPVGSAREGSGANI